MKKKTTTRNKSKNSVALQHKTRVIHDIFCFWINIPKQIKTLHYFSSEIRTKIVLLVMTPLAFEIERLSGVLLK